MSVPVVREPSEPLPEWTRHNVAALERSVLGIVIAFPERWPTVRQSLEARHIYYEKHRDIFESMEAVAVATGTPDILLVANHLRERGKLQFVGGIHYLGQLPHSVPLAASLEGHMAMLLEMFEHRTGKPADAWPEIIPFSGGKVPVFPTALLPRILAAFVHEESEATQTPAAMAGLGVLAACSAALSRKVKVHIRGDWKEPLNLYTVSVLPPAARKSQVIGDVEDPLKEWEREELRIRAAEISAARATYAVLQGRADEAKKKATRAKGDDKAGALEAAVAAALEAEEFKMPQIPRLLADDATPEALAALMAEHNERMAIFSGEGTTFELMCGRYSQNGSANIEIYLQSFKGETYRVDRKGKAPVILESPALTLCLAVQPDVIESMSQKGGLRGRGFFGRCLYAMPENMLGSRRIAAPAMNQGTKAQYGRLLSRLLCLEMPEKAHVVRFSTEADAVMREFEEWMEPRLGPFGDLGGMSDWGGKLAGAVARIAGILHMVEHSEVRDAFRSPVGPGPALAAVGIAEFCIPHAKAVYQQMEADPLVAAARHLLAWIHRERRQCFTRREIHQGCRGRFRHMTQLNGPLEALKRHGYIKLFENNEERKRGRPSEKFLVNPDSWNIEDFEDAFPHARAGAHTRLEDTEGRGD